MHKWEADFVAYDRDGTLTEIPDGGVVVYKNSMNSNECNASASFVNAVACPKYDYVRIWTYWSQLPFVFADSRNNTMMANTLLTFAVNQSYSLVVNDVNHTNANQLVHYYSLYSLNLGEYL